MKDNAFFKELEERIFAREKADREHKARKKEILEAFGPESPEMNAWYKEDADLKRTNNGGEVKAYLAWSRGTDEPEMDEYLMEDEVEGYVGAFRKAGIKTFVVTNRSTAVMENIHWLTKAGCRLEGPCTIIRREERWGITEDRKVLGLRFAIG